MDFEENFIVLKEKDESFHMRMDDDLDYAFALSLQEDCFNDEPKNSVSQVFEIGKASTSYQKPLSIIDEQWEMIDPHPDIHSLFIEFNAKFFFGKLVGVEVKWSPRMTLCAGVCSYEGRGGLCSVRLSVPLLKLRPRKDLVETLLHEMIHAYLFVTANNKDHDAHGPEFLSHMHRINKETGTRISVYHSFHDEVDLYRTHWWKCNGPCQKKRPFFGLVKRAMNRVPGPKDTWWAQHQATCGGSFIKIKEPDNYKKKSTKRKTDDNELKDNQNIKRFFTPQSSMPQSSVSIDNKLLPNIHSVQSLLGKEEALQEISNFNHTVSNSNHISNTNNPIPFAGKGQCLGSVDSSKPKSLLYLLHQERSQNRSESQKLAQKHLLKQVNTKETIKNISTGQITQQGISKHSRQRSINTFLSSPKQDIKITVSTETVLCPVCHKSIQQKDINEHLDTCLIV